MRSLAASPGLLTPAEILDAERWRRILAARALIAVQQNAMCTADLDANRRSR
jgi:hypothetical protein